MEPTPKEHWDILLKSHNLCLTQYLLQAQWEPRARQRHLSPPAALIFLDEQSTHPRVHQHHWDAQKRRYRQASLSPTTFFLPLIQIHSLPWTTSLRLYWSGTTNLPWSKHRTYRRRTLAPYTSHLNGRPRHQQDEETPFELLMLPKKSTASLPRSSLADSWEQSMEDQPWPSLRNLMIILSPWPLRLQTALSSSSD